MTRPMKIGAVAAGYAAAFVAAKTAAWLYDWRVSSLPYDTSGGMYAFGQMITAVGAFLAVALPTTGLVVWFMRATPLWNRLATALLAFVATCVLAVVAAFL